VAWKTWAPQSRAANTIVRMCRCRIARDECRELARQKRENDAKIRACIGAKEYRIQKKWWGRCKQIWLWESRSRKIALFVKGFWHGFAVALPMINDFHRDEKMTSKTMPDDAMTTDADACRCQSLPMPNDADDKRCQPLLMTHDAILSLWHYQAMLPMKDDDCFLRLSRANDRRWKTIGCQLLSTHRLVPLCDWIGTLVSATASDVLLQKAGNSLVLQRSPCQSECKHYRCKTMQKIRCQTMPMPDDADDKRYLHFADDADERR